MGCSWLGQEGLPQQARGTWQGGSPVAWVIVTVPMPVPSQRHHNITIVLGWCCLSPDALSPQSLQYYFHFDCALALYSSPFLSLLGRGKKKARLEHHNIKLLSACTHICTHPGTHIQACIHMLPAGCSHLDVQSPVKVSLSPGASS
jgi:hypothetical protein